MRYIKNRMIVVEIWLKSKWINSKHQFDWSFYFQFTFPPRAELFFFCLFSQSYNKNIHFDTAVTAITYNRINQKQIQQSLKLKPLFFIYFSWIASLYFGFRYYQTPIRVIYFFPSFLVLQFELNKHKLFRIINLHTAPSNYFVI